MTELLSAISGRGILQFSLFPSVDRKVQIVEGLIQTNQITHIIAQYHLGFLVTDSNASFSQTALKGEVGKNKQKNQEVAKI